MISPTPGTWEAFGNAVGVVGVGLILVPYDSKLLPDGESTGNARLAAAAPDMLAALKLVAKASMRSSDPERGETTIGWQRGDGASSFDAMDAVIAAIAIAEAAP